SPYQAYSAFAGNPWLISPDDLRADGLLDRADPGAEVPPGRVDFDRVAAVKDRLLARAWENFNRGAAPALRQPFDEYRVAQAAWLDDYALFLALREGGPAGA